MKKLLLSAIAIAALALVSAPQAMAQEEPEPEPAPLTFCEGTLSNQVVEGDVVVPIGASCVLDRVVVRGNVVGTVDAVSLVVRRSFVDGSVTCDACGRLELDRTLVQGGLDVAEASEGVQVCWSSVGQAAVVRSSSSLRIGAAPSWNACGANHFGAGLTVNRGRGDAAIAYNVVVGALTVSVRRGGTTDIRRNVVTGQLSCTNNDPAPVGANNHAAEKLGQCAAL